MFLKPQVTKDLAVRIGHKFASEYKPRLGIDVYESLLDLASKTAEELADLQLRDRIDVQSFIGSWVTTRKSLRDPSHERSGSIQVTRIKIASAASPDP